MSGSHEPVLRKKSKLSPFFNCVKFQNSTNFNAITNSPCSLSFTLFQCFPTLKNVKKKKDDISDVPVNIFVTFVRRLPTFCLLRHMSRDMEANYGKNILSGDYYFTVILSTRRPTLPVALPRVVMLAAIDVVDGVFWPFF